MLSLKNQLKFMILERFDFLIKIYENDDGNDNDDDDDCDDDDDITMTSTMQTMTTKYLKDHLKTTHSKL